MIYRFPDRRRTASGGAGDATNDDEKFDHFSAAVLAQLPRLRRYAIALVRDVSVADDLVQDCVERAFRNRRGLGDPSHLSGWLSSILHNLHIDSLRQQRRRGTSVELDDSLNLVELSVPPADRGMAKDLVRAMSALSIEHRQILLLIGLEGHSYRDVAATLNIPIGTVMSRLARARAQLRVELDQPAASMAMPAPPSPDRKLVK